MNDFFTIKCCRCESNLAYDFPPPPGEWPRKIPCKRCGYPNTVFGVDMRDGTTYPPNVKMEVTQ